MKAKARPLPQGIAIVDRDFESLLRRAAQLCAPRSPRRLKKAARRKPAAAD